MKDLKDVYITVNCVDFMSKTQVLTLFDVFVSSYIEDGGEVSITDKFVSSDVIIECVLKVGNYCQAMIVGAFSQCLRSIVEPDKVIVKIDGGI